MIFFAAPDRTGVTPSKPPLRRGGPGGALFPGPAKEFVSPRAGGGPGVPPGRPALGGGGGGGGAGPPRGARGRGRADVVRGGGGSAAGPAGLAAVRMGLPLVLTEAD